MLSGDTLLERSSSYFTTVTSESLCVWESLKTSEQRFRSKLERYQNRSLFSQRTCWGRSHIRRRSSPESSRDVLATADAFPSKINPSGPRTEKRQWSGSQSRWSFQTLSCLCFLLPWRCPFSWQKGHWATLTSTWRNTKPAHKKQEQSMLAVRQAPAVQVLLFITSYTNTTNTTTSGQEISFSLVSLVVIPFSFFLTALPQHWGFLACVLPSIQSLPAVQLTRQHLPFRLFLVCLPLP